MIPELPQDVLCKRSLYMSIFVGGRATEETDMFINVMTVIIVIDCVCALVATDSRAMETDPPFYTELLSHLCLVIYSADSRAEIHVPLVEIHGEFCELDTFQEVLCIVWNWQS